MKKKNKILIIVLACILVVILAVVIAVIAKLKHKKPSITLSETSITIDVGDTETLEAKTSKKGVKFDWSSADEEVATVDEDGTVTGVAEGTTFVTVSAEGYDSLNCSVTVEDPNATDSSDESATSDGETPAEGTDSDTASATESGASQVTATPGTQTQTGTGTTTTPQGNQTTTQPSGNEGTTTPAPVELKKVSAVDPETGKNTIVFETDGTFKFNGSGFVAPGNLAVLGPIDTRIDDGKWKVENNTLVISTEKGILIPMLEGKIDPYLVNKSTTEVSGDTIIVKIVGDNKNPKDNIFNLATFTLTKKQAANLGITIG